LPGLLVPRTVRLMPGQRGSTVAAERGMAYPLLVRSAGIHAIRDSELIKVETADALDAALAAGAVAMPAYMTEFVDTRDAQGLYRKMRLIVCGSTVVLRHYIHSDQWLIKAAAQPFMYERPKLLALEREAAASPLSVLPARGPELLGAIKQRIGLDYFGIDCAPLPDGRLLVFEVNACMNMLPASRHPVRGPFTVAAIDRIAGDFTALVVERSAGKRAIKEAASLTDAAGRGGR
jgi:hypothetical protein